MSNSHFSQWVAETNQKGLGGYDRNQLGTGDIKKTPVRTTDWDHGWDGFRSGNSISLEKAVRQQAEQNFRQIFCCSSLDDTEEITDENQTLEDELVMSRRY